MAFSPLFAAHYNRVPNIVAIDGGIRALSHEHTFGDRLHTLSALPPQGHSIRIAILIPWPVYAVKGLKPRLQLLLMAKSPVVITTKMGKY